MKELVLECRVDAAQAFDALKAHLLALEQKLRDAEAKLAAADAELQRHRAGATAQAATMVETPPPPPEVKQGFRFGT